jgi:hypothetical protein
MVMPGCQLQQQQQQQGRAAATRRGDQQVLPIRGSSRDSTRNHSHKHLQQQQQQQQGLAAAVEQLQSTCHAVPACSQTTACCLMAWPVMFWVAVQQGWLDLRAVTA